MNIDFLTPVSDEILDSLSLLSVLSVGNNIQIHSEDHGFPLLEDVQVVVLGVNEGRKAINNEGCGDGLFEIRSELYKLFPSDWHVQIADIGDVKRGNTIKDTYFAVSEIVRSLIKKNIIPVIIGGSQDLTYANYRAYDSLEQTVNLVVVDSRFDLGNIEDDLTSKSFLSKIVMEEPNNLFNYSNIGYQTYFNSKEEIDLLEKLYFDSYRLGEVKNLELVEPIMRDADIVSVDLGSVRQSDAPANKNTSPNGFYGEEICAIARYAGISDKVTSFGVYEYNKYLDVQNTTASLLAQVIWYFIEGVNNRAKDYPYTTKESYQKFIVVLEDDEPINFYKSDKSGRWWMEINLLSDTKHKRHTLIPCAYQDYVQALEQKIPEKWYKALHKLT